MTNPTSDGSYFHYDRHEEEWERILHDPERNSIGETWLRHDTVDYWRHQRMREPLKAIVHDAPDASWLTVGDGRYGTDGQALMAFGAKNVHCTDISDKLLKVARQRELISTYSAQNAESLNFEDDAFDYVYCKESFHHFPRPYLALTEMFRVARKAVILTEPRDQAVDKALVSSLLSGLRRLLGRRSPEHLFEPVGNYVYALSEREVEKFLLGMHYTTVAFLGVNDAYEAGVETTPMEAVTPAEKQKKRRIMGKILLLDTLCQFGLTRSALLTAVLFKEMPRDALSASLQATGFRIKQLPINPHLSD